MESQGAIWVGGLYKAINLGGGGANPISADADLRFQGVIGTNWQKVFLIAIHVSFLKNRKNHDLKLSKLSKL